MSPRKPTIDGLDDIDDEDGIVEEEQAEQNDLTLHEAPPEAVGLGGSEAAAERAGRPPHKEDKE